VVVSGGGHAGGYWVEVAPGTGLVGGQYIVDYSTGVNGGTITHAAADANTPGVQAVFTAGTLASATVVNNIIQALQDAVAFLNTKVVDLSPAAPQTGSVWLNGSVTASAESLFSSGVFVDPHPGVTDAVKISQGLSADVVRVVGLILAAGLNIPGQTSNHSASSVANQRVGTFKIPAGTTAPATNFTIANTSVTAQSIVLLTLTAPVGQVSYAAHNVAAQVPGTSFTVDVFLSGTLTQDVDCHYFIIN